jgi:hypothetical protein
MRMMAILCGINNGIGSSVNGTCHDIVRLIVYRMCVMRFELAFSEITGPGCLVLAQLY